MGQGDLSRLREASSSNQGHVADRMMRRTKRPNADQRSILAQLSGDAVNLRRLQCFIQCQWRKDRRQALGQHRLAGTRRSDEYQVVPARSRHLHSAFNVLLTLHVGEIEFRPSLALGEFLLHVNDRALDDLRAVQEFHDFHHRLHAINFQPTDYGRLTRILLGKNETLKPFGPGLYGDGQHALDGLQSAIERQLPHDDEFLQRVLGDLVGTAEYAHGNGQVVRRSLLADVGRGHVHRELVSRIGVAAVLERRDDALLAFLHGAVGKSDEDEVHAAAEIHFYRDCCRIHAIHGASIGLDQHALNIVGLIILVLRQK